MAAMIVRDPQRATSERFDLIVVGGGIYGVALTLEASRAGLRALLLERKDFGHATSWNSLRILHGGLRYLQTLDLHRFRETVGERSWFLRTFPDLVQPLPCLMPLYGDGLRRRGVLACALKLNDYLSRARNLGVRDELHLADGRIVSTSDTRELFPAVEERGLRGGALWHDAVMPTPSRVIVEMLRWACSLGATALNYVSGEAILLEQGRVAGVRASDELSASKLEFRGPVVINCAGPWSRLVAQRFDRDVERLFRPSLALNLLIDREPAFGAGVAVRPRTPGGQTYFLYPWQGRILAGTHHAPWNDGPDGAGPPDEEVEKLMTGLRTAIPALTFDREQVRHVLWGLLPASAPGSARLAVREVLCDHRAHGGPAGLFSVSGVKFTTARLVAEKTMKLAFPELAPVGDRPATDRPPPATPPAWEDFCERARRSPGRAREELLDRMQAEAATSVDDLACRRTGWALTDAERRTVCRRLETLLGGEPLPAESTQRHSTPQSS